MADLEIGKCDICYNPSIPIQRKYYEYNIKCDCCSSKDSNHFEIVRHCSKCNPKPPKSVRVIMTPNN